MPYRVFQHWDPLRVCVVGRCYPPEFFSWVKNIQVRKLFEQIAIETEEDLQKIVQKLEEFNVKIFRPDLPDQVLDNGIYRKPPITPRDHMVMIGEKFYESYSTNFSAVSYNNIKDSSWPDCKSWDEFNCLPMAIQEECKTVFDFGNQQIYYNEYNSIIENIRNNGNVVKSGHVWVNGAMCARIGKDLFFGTDDYAQDLEETKKMINQEFTKTRNHVVNTGGHSDATYCPVCPGLIISTHDVDSYRDTFPGWEVVYIKNENLSNQTAFRKLQSKNGGKWWIPGFEHNNNVIDFVESYLAHWTGYVLETVFDVNMLIVDPTNVVVFNENKILFDALARYGITPHVITFRHRNFWDGGIHCLTLDLDRQGTQQDFFNTDL